MERSQISAVVEPSSGTLPLGGAGGSPSFTAGELIGGRYRVVRLLGHGGMGEVYEVDDHVLGARLALKTVRGDSWRDALAGPQLKRELQLARKISHKGICRIYDLGTHGEGATQLPFFTMELIAGETLSQRIARDGRLRLEQALPLVEQLGGALTAAHHAGVIHCDLKSSNILITGERAVITDFGLADASAGATSAALMGSPAYMAPEQVTGGAISAATDVYALGVVLYEMLTGRLPFLADSARATAELRLEQQPPPPRGHAPELDLRCEAAILRCLEIDPRRRFRSPAAAIAALRPAARRRKRMLLIAAGLAVPAAAAIALAGGGPAATPAAVVASGCGYQGPVRIDEYRDRAAFERAAGPHRRIDFDDVDTHEGAVSIAGDRYAESLGAVLRGTDGQWVDRTFGYPADFIAASPPNGFAPGPRAPADASLPSGGHDSDLTFRERGVDACVGAVGAVFEDADYDFPGEPTGVAIYDRAGAPLGNARTRLVDSGSSQFLGLVARRPDGEPALVIARAHFVNGNAWPEVGQGEGVVLDDLEFGAPRAR